MDIVRESAGGGEWRAFWVGGVQVQVRLVAGVGVPGAGVVVGHEVVEVEVGGHFFEAKFLVVLGS